MHWHSIPISIKSFWCKSLALLALYAIIMEWGIQGFIQRLIAKYIYSFFLNFDRQWRFGQLDALIYLFLILYQGIPQDAQLNWYPVADAGIKRVSNNRITGKYNLCRVNEEIKANKRVKLRIIWNACEKFIICYIFHMIFPDFLNF